MTSPDQHRDPTFTTTDTLSDLYAATDAQGRCLPRGDEAGPPRADRFVGMFYFLWMGQHGTGGPYDITKILAEEPEAMQPPDSPRWGPPGAFHHWGESQYGYYLSDDRWVLRRHAHQLADAGVDVVIFDVTNNISYEQVVHALGETWSAVRAQGNPTPGIAFLTPFWTPAEVVRRLYDEVYAPGLFQDLWFYWKGKPLIMADPALVDPALREFFTFRKPEPSYFAGPSGPEQWGWLEVAPQHVFYDRAGRPEQMTVGIAQNAQRAERLSAFSEADTCGRSWHDGARDSRPDAVRLGLNFSEQWQRALQVDPEFVFVTGWNEWIAQRMNEFNGVREPVMFVDNFTREYSRDIEPMRGGHGDDYYYQFAAFVRRYKGVRPAPPASGPQTIELQADFAQWTPVTPDYRDHAGDTAPRDHPGYDDVGRYVDDSGRNDLLQLKVTRDSEYIYFYARTAAPITPHSNGQWMQLYLRLPESAAPDWAGYHFVVNRTVIDGHTSLLESCAGGWLWRAVTPIHYRVEGCELHLAIPRAALGLAVETPLRLEFKWVDNNQVPGDVLDFNVHGDAAPAGRFNFVYEG